MVARPVLAAVTQRPARVPASARRRPQPAGLHIHVPHREPVRDIQMTAVIRHPHMSAKKLRTVVNSDQARRLLAAVGQQDQRGERMVAFFGCIYYAALRPEEVVDVRIDNLVSLPDQGWGELLLTNSEPRSGTWWTDSGSARQRRELKHRPRGETRLVPLHPELVATSSASPGSRRKPSAVSRKPPGLGMTSR